MNCLRITKAWTILLVYILASMAGAAEPLVLCLGTKGHIDIESTGLNQSCDGPCDAYSKYASNAPRVNIAETTSKFCGPCVDIPILAGSSGRQSQQLRPSEDLSNSWQNKQMTARASTSVVMCYAETPEKKLSSSYISTTDSTITSLRTVIFLV